MCSHMGTDTPCALVSQPYGSDKAFSLGEAQRDGKSSGGGGNSHVRILIVCAKMSTIAFSLDTEGLKIGDSSI